MLGLGKGPTMRRIADSGVYGVGGVMSFLRRHIGTERFLLVCVEQE